MKVIKSLKKVYKNMHPYYRSRMLRANCKIPKRKSKKNV